jgi:VanZ family protein
MSAPDPLPKEDPGPATSRVRDWLPVVGWMAVIFVGSTDAFSPAHTSRIVGPLLRWLFPGLSPLAIDRAVPAVRKAAHLGEYALLAGLCWRALWRSERHDSRRWAWRPAALAVLACALWASTDELHQAFTADRTASGWDVVLDATGAGVGLFLLWRLGVWRRWW